MCVRRVIGGFAGVWLLAALVASGGCGGEDLPSSTQPGEGPTRVVTQDFAPPYRLARALLAQRRAESRGPLVIPLDGAWRVYNGAGAPSRDALGIKADDAPAFAQLPLAFDTRDYNVFRVTMQVDRGKTCLLKAQTDLDPRFDRQAGVSMPLFPGEEPHTYEFLLDSLAPDMWAGTVRTIEFWPSDEPASATITAMEFAYRAPEAPRRLTLANTTHEAVYGNVSWPITVPEAAVFETHVGMTGHSWQILDTDGAQFTVRVEGEGVPKRVIADVTLTPTTDPAHRVWVPVRADLAGLAGKSVCLDLAVDSLGSATGDYAFWGSPALFSSRVGSGAPVLLISLDTLRADHVSCYGYERETTPHLDAWAASDAVLFENAFVQETWTVPSHASMFTGLYPKHHGVSANSNLAEKAITLAEALGDAGRLTAGFTGMDWWLMPWRGFGHGFDMYDNADPTFRHVFKTLPLVKTWIEAHPAPWFVFLHTFDIHSKTYAMDYTLPYDPDDPRFIHFAAGFEEASAFERPGVETRATHFLMAANLGHLEVTARERDYMVAMYDDCIRMTDQALHEFFMWLKDRGLYDGALIIVTADHGESFGEHGRYLHEETYGTCSHVPLMIKFPHSQHAGLRVPGLVESVDLFPTILEALGVPLDHEVDGRSLLPLAAESGSGREHIHTQRLTMQAVRSAEWALHRDTAQGRKELFNVTEDPGELSNVYDAYSDRQDDLKSELRRFFEGGLAGWHLAFRPGGKPWSPELLLTTEDRFALSRFMFSHREEVSAREDGRTIGGALILSVGEDEELILRTESPGSRVNVSVSSTEPFDVLAGEQPARTVETFQATLDAATADLNSPPHAAHSERPSLSIWYKAPPLKGAEGPALSEEERELLNSLGYIGNE